MFAYRGYEPKDERFGDAGCLAALGVALFPATSHSSLVCAIHHISAAALFLILAYFSMVLFTIRPIPAKG